MFSGGEMCFCDGPFAIVLNRAEAVGAPRLRVSVCLCRYDIFG